MENLTPSSLLVYGAIQDKDSKRLLRVIVNGGGIYTMMYERYLPSGGTPSLMQGGARKIDTINDTMNTSRISYWLGQDIGRLIYTY